MEDLRELGASDVAYIVQETNGVLLRYLHRMSDQKASIIRQHSHIRSFQYISKLNAKLTVTM